MLLGKMSKPRSTPCIMRIERALKHSLTMVLKEKLRSKGVQDFSKDA